MTSFKLPSFIALASLVFVSCQESNEQTETTDAAAMTVEERATFEKTGKAAVQDLAGNLGTRLKTAVEEGGPISAVRVCQQVAQAVTTSTGEKLEGVTIARTALRYRNPKNAPDEIDREILQDWQDRKKAEEILPDFELVTTEDGMIRFYKPIMLQPICLNCHGPEEQLLPELKTTLDELYPEDQARNFKVGDLRGVFRVEIDPAVITP